MIALLIIVFVLSALVIALSLLLYRASRKLLTFDDLIGYLLDDMETNILYFDKLSSTPVLSDSPEIMDANRNMRIMAIRLDEFLTRFEEISGGEFRKRTKRMAKMIAPEGEP